jgi:hypothetical protein
VGPIWNETESSYRAKVFCSVPSPNVTKFSGCFLCHNSWSLVECGYLFFQALLESWESQFLLRKGSPPLVAFLTMHLETTFSGESRSLACRLRSPLLPQFPRLHGIGSKSTQILLHKYVNLLMITQINDVLDIRKKRRFRLFFANNDVLDLEMDMAIHENPCIFYHYFFLLWHIYLHSKRKLLLQTNIILDFKYENLTTRI